MSSEHPSGAPSPNPDPAGGASGLAALLRSRGAPLVEALDQHVPGAREHAEGTASYAFAAAVELGFERGPCEVTREVARLHEVGQVYVPARVLVKPTPERDPDEQRAFEFYYEAGYRLARGAGIPEYCCQGLLRARESYDGSGPEGLRGDAIPIESRICRVACACARHLAEAGQDAPIGARAGRTVAALGADAGRGLDPAVVEALAISLHRIAPAADQF